MATVKSLKELFYAYNDTPQEEIEADKAEEKNEFSVIYAPRDEKDEEIEKRNREEELKAQMKAAEKEINKYLNKTLFPYLVNNGLYKNISNCVSAYEDITGTDVTMTTNKGERIRVDHKAQLMYLNNPTNTWSMELRYNDKKGNRVDGWFLQCQPGHPDGHNTDYLALTYMDNIKTNKLKDFSADKIEKLTVLYVKVSDIAEYLAEKGKTPDVLKAEAEKASEIFHNRVEGLDIDDPKYKEARRIKEDIFLNLRGKHDAYYYVSDGKKDVNSCPVNIIIKKNILESLPHSFEYTVEPNKVIDKGLHERKISVKTLRDEARNNSFKTNNGPQKELIQA